MMKRLKIAFFIFFLIPYTMVCQENHNPFDVVVIDPGHGGKDLGAPGGVCNEKDITLTLALKVGRLIQERMLGVIVFYTRDDDRFVPLHKRAAIANDSLADLFISIHCNSNTEPEYFGAETYVMGIHKSAENLEVAKTENAAILMEENYADAYGGFDPESDEDYITLNMFQSSSMEQSIRFSMMVQERLKNTARMYDRGVKQAGFVVLYLTTMPGALIETGFISNPAEEKYLLDADNQDSISHAIFQAVHDYRAYHDKSTHLQAPRAKDHTDPKPQTPETVYRICFARSNHLEPFEHRMFEGISEMWAYEQEGSFCYTFGKTGNYEEAREMLNKYLQSGRHKKSFSIQPRIVKFSVIK